MNGTQRIPGAGVGTPQRIPSAGVGSQLTALYKQYQVRRGRTSERTAMRVAKETSTPTFVGVLLALIVGLLVLAVGEFKFRQPKPKSPQLQKPDDDGKFVFEARESKIHYGITCSWTTDTHVNSTDCLGFTKPR